MQHCENIAVTLSIKHAGMDATIFAPRHVTKAAFKKHIVLAILSQYVATGCFLKIPYSASLHYTKIMIINKAVA